MAMTAGTVRVSNGAKVSGTYPPQGVTGELNNFVVSQSADAAAALSYGTASGQADLLVCQDRTLAATTAATYDLYTGTDLKDLAGLTAALRKVKYLGVFIVSGGDTAGVAIGGAANPWPGFFADVSDKAKIFPSGPPYQGGSPAGVATVVTTGINLKVENLGAVSVTVRIVIAGTSV